MSEENYAGNIIISLANMPDFLRTPILKKRITEFYTLDEVEQKNIVYNALQAAPDIPFPNFGKLFGTWLKVMAELPQENQICRCLHRTLQWQLRKSAASCQISSSHGMLEGNISLAFLENLNIMIMFQ